MMEERSTRIDESSKSIYITLILIYMAGTLNCMIPQTSLGQAALGSVVMLAMAALFSKNVPPSPQHVQALFLGINGKDMHWRKFNIGSTHQNW